MVVEEGGYGGMHGMLHLLMARGIGCFGKADDGEAGAVSNRDKWKEEGRNGGHRNDDSTQQVEEGSVGAGGTRSQVGRSVGRIFEMKS